MDSSSVLDAAAAQVSHRVTWGGGARGVQRLFILDGHHDQSLRYLIILKEPFRNLGYDYDVFFVFFFLFLPECGLFKDMV